MTAQHPEPMQLEQMKSILRAAVPQPPYLSILLLPAERDAMLQQLELLSQPISEAKETK